jgi:hypothetical protein
VSSTVPSLLDRASARDVVLDPFPHLVVRDALEPDLYRRLVEALPPPASFGGAHGASNVRMNLMAHQVLREPAIDPLWRELVRRHTSPTFFRQVAGVFGKALLDARAPARDGLERLKELRTGVRHVDREQDTDVLLDAMLAINTPVVGAPSSVRGPHVDLPNKLFSGLFYMRHHDDRSTGGDLELFRFRHRQPGGFVGCEVEPAYVELVKTIPYEANVLVLFLNTIDAIHGVSARSVTPLARRFLCLIAQVRSPRFDPARYALTATAPAEAAPMEAS